MGRDGISCTTGKKSGTPDSLEHKEKAIAIHCSNSSFRCVCMWPKPIYLVTLEMIIFYSLNLHSIMVD